MLIKYSLVSLLSLSLPLSQATEAPPAAPEIKQEAQQKSSDKTEEYKKSYKDMLDNLEKLNSLLSKVTDNDSAEKSASEIKKIGDKLNSIKKDIASKKKTLSDEEQKKVEGQYTEKAEEISMAFFGNLLRINNIEISSSEWEQALAVIEACMNSEQDSANTDSADKAPQPEA